MKSTRHKSSLHIVSLIFYRLRRTYDFFGGRTTMGTTERDQPDSKPNSAMCTDWGLVLAFGADFLPSSDLFVLWSQQSSGTCVQNRMITHTSSASSLINSEDFTIFLVEGGPWGRLDRFRSGRLQTRPNMAHWQSTGSNLGGSRVGFLSGRHILRRMLYGNAEKERSEV